jgi:hypothetical protein
MSGGFTILETKNVIYGVGILLTFSFSMWNLIVNYRTTRKINFINTVTSQRIKQDKI